jgi:hypothetical protein
MIALYIVANRAVRKGEIPLFEAAITVYLEHLTGEMTGLLSVCHSSVEPRSEEIPGLEVSRALLVYRQSKFQSILREIREIHPSGRLACVPKLIDSTEQAIRP